MKLSVFILVINFVVGIISYFTLAVHIIEVLYGVLVLNGFSSILEIHMLYRHSEVREKVMGIGLGRCIFLFACIGSLKFHSENLIPIITVGIFSSAVLMLLLMRFAINRTESAVFSLILGMSIGLIINYIPSKISYEVVPMESIKVLPNQTFLKNFGRYRAQVAIKTGDSVTKFNVMDTSSSNLVLGKISNLFESNIYFVKQQ